VKYRLLTFTGDLYNTGPFDGSVLENHNLIINFEGVVTKGFNPVDGKVNLSLDDTPLKSLFRTTPIAANLANNHIMDYGIEGLLHTRRYLEEQDIHFWGAGSFEENAGNPMILKFDSQKIGLIGYVKIDVTPNYVTESKPGVQYPSRDVIIKDIQKCKDRNADRIVVCLHWGVEEVYLPKPEDVDLAHFIIDSGADLIVGHHSHCIQPWERYNNKYIFYGLGNLFFSDLDTNAFYDNKGQALRRYKKKQKHWNKKSLIVHYDPINNKVSIQSVSFSDNKLFLKSFVRTKYRLKMFTKRIYNIRFMSSYIFGKTRKVVFDILENPKSLLSINTYKHYYLMLKTYRFKA
jgi:hypothetical protein